MKKLYYSIGEVSEITDVDADVLRYWESVFDELSLKKNKAGNRTYKEKDIETIVKLKELVQKKKYSTKGAQQVLKQQGEASSTGDNEVTVILKIDLKEYCVILNILLKR